MTMEFYCDQYKDIIEKHAYFISRNNDCELLREDLQQEGYLLVCEEYNKGTIHNYKEAQVYTAVARTMLKYVRRWKGDDIDAYADVEQLPA